MNSSYYTSNKNFIIYSFSILFFASIFSILIWLATHIETISSHLTFITENLNFPQDKEQNIATFIKNAIAVYPVGTAIMIILTLCKDLATYGSQDKNNIYLKIWSDGCKVALLLITFAIFVMAYCN